jgi:hypothetical protein
MLRSCRNCSKEFFTRRSNQRFCSSRCRNHSFRTDLKRRYDANYYCAMCNSNGDPDPGVNQQRGLSPLCGACFAFLKAKKMRERQFFTRANEVVRRIAGLPRAHWLIAVSVAAARHSAEPRVLEDLTTLLLTLSPSNARLETPILELEGHGAINCYRLGRLVEAGQAHV